MDIPSVMVSLDPSPQQYGPDGKLHLTHRWNAYFYELLDHFKQSGCTHYKFHPYPSFPGQDLKSSIASARKAVLPGKSADVLVDTKEHDTALTVLHAIEDYLYAGANRITVHSSCGPEVFGTIRRAGLAKHVIAVTVLTDMTNDDVERVYGGSFEDVSVRLASIPLEHDVRWLVSAAPDIPNLQKRLMLGPSDCKFATPGIRPAGAAKGGQVRIATPREAVHFGSNMLIIGRPFLGVRKPGKKFAACSRVVQRAAEEKVAA